MNKDLLQKSLIKHEGLRLKPYKDTVGVLTIGVGRNLDDMGIRQSEAMLMLDNDIQLFSAQLLHLYPWFQPLDDVRQNVMIELMFILGPSRFSTFKNMIHYMEIKDYKNAASEIRNSKLASDIGPIRTKDLCDALESGLP